MPSPARCTGNSDLYETQATLLKGGIAADLGDLMFRDTDGYDKPADLYVGATDLATTQISFKAVFIGVNFVHRLAVQTLDSNRTESGAGVYVAGEFVFPCTALGSAASRGALVAPAQGVSTTTLNPKLVAITATANKAIGILSEDAAVGATNLKFTPMPVSFNRGVQAIV